MLAPKAMVVGACLGKGGICCRGPGQQQQQSAAGRLLLSGSQLRHWANARPCSPGIAGMLAAVSGSPQITKTLVVHPGLKAIWHICLKSVAITVAMGLAATELAGASCGKAAATCNSAACCLPGGLAAAGRGHGNRGGGTRGGGDGNRGGGNACAGADVVDGGSSTAIPVGSGTTGGSQAGCACGACHGLPGPGLTCQDYGSRAAIFCG